MRVIFAGNEKRGLPCLLRILQDGHEVVCVLSTPAQSEKYAYESRMLGLRVEQSENVNSPEMVSLLRSLQAEVTVLAGFSQIVKGPFLAATKHGAINLHAGQLPQMRGSSPLNWALILGAEEVTFSVIQVDTGVDTGPVVEEKTFPITPASTISDLHDIANGCFPELVASALRKMQGGDFSVRVQSNENATYYPLRFPEDGLIVWDLMDQDEVKNRVRALSKPYPGAFTIFQGRKLSIQATNLPDVRFKGEPGRVYRIGERGLLVGTRTDGLWISEAYFEDEPGKDFRTQIKRYDSFLTVRSMMLQNLRRAVT